MTDVAPFTIDVPKEQLDDLQRRLASARWPERETVQDFSQGLQLSRLKRLVEYWQTQYDWRRCEAMLNAFGQHRTEIDGLNIHFLHVRSRNDGALPLLLTHGWPGSVLEFSKVIEPLTDPEAHGGKRSDAFHVIVPSLPGFGFSDKPQTTGWTLTRTAKAWSELMKRLRYNRYVAQGGDLGAGVTTHMGRLKPEGLAAIHLNFPLLFPPPIEGEPDATEKAALGQLRRYRDNASGYAQIQKTRPQTLGYGLTDSPIGQAAWIYEKIIELSGDGVSYNDVLSFDEVLDNITLYWLTATATSSARLYWESWDKDWGMTKVDIPVGCSIFPGEIYRAPHLWATRAFSNLFYWNELDRGGHFAAYEQPWLFVDEMRACFRTIR